MVRTGNFQPLKYQKKQSESHFWQETAKVNPKRGNFWQQICDSIASRRTFPPIAPLYAWGSPGKIIFRWGMPFVLLLGREPRSHPGFLAAVAVLILLGLLLERAVLVFPLVVTTQAISPLGVGLAALILAALGCAYRISCGSKPSRYYEEAS